MKDILSFFAKRYIAGEAREDAVRVAEELNAHGILATIDNLGENVEDEAGAENGVEEYQCLLEEIKKAGVNSGVSLKLTHLGLDISPALARDNVERIIKKAHALNNFVRFDMEGSAYTQATIDIFLGLRERYQNIGIAIQTCLRRSERDVALLIQRGASVRLVKGAYKEPPDVAFESKRDVDENYSRLMKELLLRGSRPALATHDERLIDEAKDFTGLHGIPKDSFEFQMLLGIKRKLQKRLVEEGYTVRVYVPYGPEWLAYVLRRFGERKENVWFFIKNIFG